MEHAKPRWAAPPRRVGQRADERLLQRQPLITLAAAAAAGILCGEQLPTSLVLLTALLAAVAGWWFSSQNASYVLALPVPLVASRLAWTAVLLTFAALFAILKVQSVQRLDEAALQPFLRHAWQPIVAEATIVDRLELRPDRLAESRQQGTGRQWQSIFGVEVSKLRIRDDWRAVSGRARVIADGDWSELLPGDQIRILGQIQAIPPPRNAGEIDLRQTYRRRGEIARIRVDYENQIRLLPGASWSPARLLARLGTTGESLLNRRLGEDQGPLAAALVLGRREAVDRQTREKLLVTGTAHLLSVSGMHLGMVAVVATWLLAFCGTTRYRQIAIVLSICIIYAALTGGRPPVLRAALIIGAVLIGMWTGRVVHPLNALAFAACVLLMVNPENVGSIGVQLSFVAVAALIFAGRHVALQGRRQRQQRDPLDRFLESRRQRWLRWLSFLRHRFWQALQLSFWVWIATAPLVWWQFHIITPVSVPANVLLGIPLLFALISGLATVTLGWIWDPLTLLPAFTCRVSLGAIEQLIEWLAAFSWGHAWLPAPPGWWVAVFYLFIAAGCVLPKSWSRSRWLLTWAIIWTVVAFYLATAGRQRWLHGLADGTLEATFIDVGHGTSVLIRHPGGGNWIYDCGRLGDPSQSIRPIESVLWDKGIYHLDGVILSHADSDHYNALPALLHRFSVDQIVTSPQFFETEERGLIAVREAIRRRAIPVVTKERGDVLYRSNQAVAAEAAWSSVLHPSRRIAGASDNAHSLVLRIDHGNRSLLLPGDIEFPGTEALLRCKRPVPGGILMAPHHGSLQEDIRPLLDWCRPTTIIVSGNERADRPAVRASLSQSGAELYITARSGAISLRIDGQGSVEVKPWLPEHH